jgi:predicted regulator of Ras-like GTPase activity (Roadblock/LC7/MglB family)
MPHWTLFENDFREIDSVLNELLERTNALSVHLVDRSGHLILSAGRSGDFDATAFASLVAADFTANAELSRLLGEEGLAAVVSEGCDRSIYSCLLAGRVIMCVVYDRRSTLGLVRFRANRAANELTDLFAGVFEKVDLFEPAAPGESPAASPTEPTSEEFALAASQELDALFGD